MRKSLLSCGWLVLLAATALAAAAPETGVRKYGARETAALLDMQAMRDAIEIAFLDTGYIHTLEDLNDLIGMATTHYFDDVMYGGGARVIELAASRFRSQRADLRFAPRQWWGPYVTFQQGKISIDGANYDPGTPIDPWGTPYYMFTPLGLVRPPNGAITLEMYEDAFDRYTIVCLAGDGVMSEDDLIVQFGTGVFGPPSVTVISSTRLVSTGNGRGVRVKGYKFGAPREGSAVEFNGAATAATEVASWTDREIVFALPAGAPSGLVTVVVGGTVRSNSFLLQIPTSARHWALYR